MHLVLDQMEAVGAWVGARANVRFSPPFTAIGVSDASGALVGGFVFNDYTGPSIHMSLAGNVFHRNVWRFIAHYVFVTNGCSRLEIKTRKSNRAVRKIAPRFGFKFEGVARKFYGDEDALCFAIVDEQVPDILRKWGIARENT